MCTTNAFIQHFFVYVHEQSEDNVVELVKKRSKWQVPYLLSVFVTLVEPGSMRSLASLPRNLKFFSASLPPVAITLQYELHTAKVTNQQHGLIEC